VSRQAELGWRRQVRGIVTAIKTPGQDVTEVTCHVGPACADTVRGNFAFCDFDRMEGAHLFTIASAARQNGTVTFLIKSLGDYTRNLSQKISVGQTVKVEGPTAVLTLTGATVSPIKSG